MTNYSQQTHELFAQDVANAAGLRLGAYVPVNRFYSLNGLTRENFVMLHKWAPNTSEWRLIIQANRTAGYDKDEILREKFHELPNFTRFEFRTDTQRARYEFASADEEEILEAASELAEYVQGRELGQGNVREERCGVNFIGTQFERLKERGATISGMFGNLVCQAAGMNLTMMQAEYYIEAGEIDGVEFGECGKVISIYECQAGIHKGMPLDDGHLHKALESYLYDPEIIPTVRKVVLLAGDYDVSTLNILKERGYELSRRERPIELVVLKTVRHENTISIERVNTYS
jgi:hypothetical protein